jgi:hypothetical protein
LNITIEIRARPLFGAHSDLAREGIFVFVTAVKAIQT